MKIWGLTQLLVVISAQSSDVIKQAYDACPSVLRDCWSDYRHARQSPLWAESYFRCQQLTVFYECGELKQAACIKEEPGYRQISLEIFERVKEACNASPGSDVDLTSIISLGDGVSMGKNVDSNFPVFEFDTGHNVVENALDVFENSLPSEFSIQVHLKPDGAGGVLFGIADQMRKKTRFGVEYLKLSSSNKYRINLLWIPQDASKESKTQIGQSWDFVPEFHNGWMKFAISVRREMATLYTGCNRMDTKSFYRGEGDLIINDSDLIAIGKTELFGRVFKGSIQELRIVGNSDAARDYFCDTELLDGSGDGDWDDEDEPDQYDPVEWDPEDISPNAMYAQTKVDDPNIVIPPIRNTAIPTGAPGVQGPQGEKGEPGLPGINGRDGEKGATGETGPQGPAGSDGKDGQPGLDGKDGRPGQRGERGEPGTAAVAGDSVPGQKGEPGRDGTDGVDGRDGTDGDGEGGGGEGG